MYGTLRAGIQCLFGTGEYLSLKGVGGNGMHLALFGVSGNGLWESISCSALTDISMHHGVFERVLPPSCNMGVANN